MLASLRVLKLHLHLDPICISLDIENKLHRLIAGANT